MEHSLKNLVYFVVLCYVFCVLFSTPLAQAASLSFVPASDSYTAGEAFSVGVYVASPDESMNAAEGVISFPADKLEVISLSKSGSIFSLWVQEPSFSNNSGTINFEGIVLNPGFIGSNVKLFTINFKTKTAGSASLVFASASVLANDGKGTNILTGVGTAIFSIGVTGPAAPSVTTPVERAGAPLAPIIISPTHPDTNSWYSVSAPEFSWEVPSDVTAVKLLIGEIPTVKPTVLYTPPIFEKKIEDLPDGTWYFHVRFKNKYGWGATTHRKVLVDTEPPSAFEIKVDNDGDSTTPQPILYFRADDATSDISHYEVRIGVGDSFPITPEEIRKNPYKLSLQAPGKHPVLIKALDKAGNATWSEAKIVVDPIQSPQITDYQKEMIIGEPLILRGVSDYPEAGVKIFIKSEKDVVEIGETLVDKDGNWTYTHFKTMARGIYQIWAEITDERGAVSSHSHKATVSFGLPTFIRIGKLAIDYLTIMISLLILILVLIVILFYVWLRFSRWRKSVRKETKEAQISVKKAFGALREEVEEQIAKLDKRRGLSKGEKEIRDKLKNALDVSEEYIGKEIKDIEEELN